jgi:hypothetical protein
MYEGIEKYLPEDKEAEFNFELENFSEFVIHFLETKGALRIAEKIQNGELKLLMQSKRAQQNGIMTIRAAKKNNTPCDVSKILFKEAEKTADELISSKI